MTILFPLTETNTLKLQSNYYNRIDKKDWKYVQDIDPENNYRYLKRTKWELLLSSILFKKRSVIEWGMKGIFIKTKEEKQVVDTIDNTDIASFDKEGERKEIGPFATINFPITTHLHSQYGLFLHYINKDNDTSLWYAKLQTALDVRLQDKLFIFINLTWRLHRFFEKNPYTRNPWGGGNLQLMYTM